MIFKSILVVVKFSFVLVTSTIFVVGMALNNESVIGISGIVLIGYILYRKIDQLHKQYSIFKQIPSYIKQMVSSGDFTNIYKSKKDIKNEDERGYQ